MFITDYYKFQKLSDKTKSRYDCVCSTRSYPLFEQSRAVTAIKESEKRQAVEIGDLLAYLSNIPYQFKEGAKAKAQKQISIKGKNVSSIYMPQIGRKWGYGDIKGTYDGVIINLEAINEDESKGSSFEIFIYRGGKKSTLSLLNAMFQGNYLFEIERARNRATTEK